MADLYQVERTYRMNVEASPALQEVEAFKTELLERLVSQCTAEQIALFRKLYPRGHDRNTYVTAIRQIERTLAKNRAAVAPMTVKPGDCIYCGKEICNDLGWCNSFKAAPAAGVKAALPCCPPEDPHDILCPNAPENLRAVSGVMVDAPAPIDHVGESRFEGWFAQYDPAGKGDKQRARDAYAAGLGEQAAHLSGVALPDGGQSNG